MVYYILHHHILFIFLETCKHFTNPIFTIIGHSFSISRKNIFENRGKCGYCSGYCKYIDGLKFSYFPLTNFFIFCRKDCIYCVIIQFVLNIISLIH